VALLPKLLIPIVIFGVMAYLFDKWNRERGRNAPLRCEIETRVCFETVLERVRILGTGGFRGISGQWYPLRGPKRLVVGTDAFMVSAPQALREFVLTGRECSIDLTRMPTRPVGRDRDWIVITGQANGSPVQLAITQDNLPDIWMALVGTGAVPLSDEVPAGQLTGPQGRSVQSRRYSLRGLAAALTIVLTADSAVRLTSIALPSLGGPADGGFFVAMVMFLVWFYRARVNAEGHDWPQRQSRAAAVWSWFVPVVNFWFPLQIMADIWRAGLPAESRANPATLPGIWWACVLAIFVLMSTTGSSGHPAWYAVLPIKVAEVLAAGMTALLVQKVSSGPLGRNAPGEA
jgi:hypothetical protein